MKICMVLLTLHTGNPIYFNAKRITNVHIDLHGLTFNGEKTTVVNKWYVKETPQQVVQKIEACSLK